MQLARDPWRGAVSWQEGRARPKAVTQPETQRPIQGKSPKRAAGHQWQQRVVAGKLSFTITEASSGRAHNCPLPSMSRAKRRQIGTVLSKFDHAAYAG